MPIKEWQFFLLSMKNETKHLLNTFLLSSFTTQKKFGSSLWCALRFKSFKGKKNRKRQEALFRTYCSVCRQKQNTRRTSAVQRTARTQNELSNVSELHNTILERYLISVFRFHKYQMEVQNSFRTPYIVKRR